MTVRTVGVLLGIVSIATACRHQDDSGSAPLGYLHDTAENHLRNVCPAELSISDDPSHPSFYCAWSTPAAKPPVDGGYKLVPKSFRIAITPDRRVRDIAIFVEDRAELLRVFDRVVSPVLASEPRDMLRRTIVDQGFTFDRKTKEGLFYKHEVRDGAIEWGFSPYVPSRWEKPKN